MSTSSAPICSALLLAAGRGERMRPLTDTTPKPLLSVRGKSLLQWQLEALARGGFRHTVINTAWLGGQIESQLGTRMLAPGAHQEMHLEYSREGQDFGYALETGGAICRALPFFGDVFWVAAGDIYAPDFVFEPRAVQRFSNSGMLAHIWLVPNPEHHPTGDFGLDDTRAMALNLTPQSELPRYTYSTIGLYRKALFQPPWCDIPTGNPQGQRLPLARLLRAAMDQAKVSAEIYTGAWTDVGTPARLALLNTPA